MVECKIWTIECVMFSQAHGEPQSNLLARIVRFLDAKDLNIDSIHDLISESTTAQRVPAFAFLSYWLSTNANSDKVQPKIVQAVYSIIQDIANKVPPVILFSGISDLNWNTHQPHVAGSSFLRQSYDRLQAIREMATPSTHNRILRWPQVLDHEMHAPFDKFPILSEVESDPKYQLENAVHVQRLICNRSPLEAFALMMRQKNSKLVITWALIELIRKLNFRRNIKHVELLHMFHNVISYASALAQSAHIDGQLLCQFIQTLPTVSPFLMLAISNQIVPTDYLFSFLLPPKMAIGFLPREEAKVVFLECYKFVDMSDDHELDAFLEVVPEIVFMAFFSATPEQKPLLPGDGLAEVMINLHTHPITIGDKVGMILNEAKRQLRPEILCAMHRHTLGGVIRHVLHKEVIPGSRRIELDTNRGEGADAWKLVATILAQRSPMSSEELERSLFVQYVFRDQELIWFGRLMKFGAHVLADMPLQRRILPFLLARLKDENPNVVLTARLILTKFLISGVLRLNATVINELKQCEDVFVVLEYIEALDGFTHTDQVDELKQLKDLRDSLIAKLPFTCETSGRFWITGVQLRPPNGSTTKWNELSRQTIGVIQNIMQTDPQVDLLRSIDVPVYLLVRVLCLYKPWMANPIRSRGLTGLIAESLRDTRCDYPKDPLVPVRRCDLALTTAHTLLKRLLYCYDTDSAEALLDRMEELLKGEPLLQHWLFRFTHTMYGFLTPQIRTRLMGIVEYLPDGKDCFIPEGPKQIRKMMRRLCGTGIALNQNPSTIQKEYQSQSSRLETYYAICLLLRNISIEQLVNELVAPFFDHRLLVDDKDLAFERMAHIIAEMPKEIGIRFIQQAMSRPLTISVINSLRLIVTCAPLDMFQEICCMAQVLIHQDKTKVYPFMSVIMPCINRLKSDDRTATQLLCGLLESVDSSMPIELQESVIDAVGLVYVMYKLHKSRPELITAAKKFAPELKAIIASSLDVDFDFGQTCRGVGDQVTGRHMVQHSSLVFWQ